MDENRFRILGRTGLKVGRLEVACSYGAPAAAFEEAFEQGINYFYWGSRRKEPMGDDVQKKTHPELTTLLVGTKVLLSCLKATHSKFTESNLFRHLSQMYSFWRRVSAIGITSFGLYFITGR